MADENDKFGYLLEYHGLTGKELKMLGDIAEKHSSSFENGVRPNRKDKSLWDAQLWVNSDDAEKIRIAMLMEGGIYIGLPWD